MSFLQRKNGVDEMPCLQATYETFISGCNDSWTSSLLNRGPPSTVDRGQHIHHCFPVSTGPGHRARPISYRCQGVRSKWGLLHCPTQLGIICQEVVLFCTYPVLRDVGVSYPGPRRMGRHNTLKLKDKKIQIFFK